MIPTVLSLILLVSVEVTGEGERTRLIFDGPVGAFAQQAAASPPSLILTIPEAAASDETIQAAAREGLLLEPAPAGALRVTISLPRGARAGAAASASEILITRRIDPILPATLAAAAASSTSGQGGIPPAPASPPAPSAAGRADYLIGPEDLLEINVFELPELKSSTRVLGDGTVSLPLLGVVQAAGLTRTGLESRLRDLLSERFLLDPQVTISVTEHRSKMVSVIGAVTKPGTYQMIGPRTVLQMISEAGGLTKEAGADIVILRRSEAGQSERIRIDLDDLVIRGNPELDLPLSAGDVVNVPVDRPIYVYVDGAVKVPGQVESRSSRPITLLQAVARAGGLTERANLRGVHVLRKEPAGGQVRIPVNLRDIRKGKADDVELIDGDVVVIPETFF